MAGGLSTCGLLTTYEHECSAQSDDPEQLLLCPGDYSGIRKDNEPKNAVAADAAGQELPRASRDDGDDRRTDAVEGALHPGEPSKSQVERREEEHHQQRRPDEGESYRRCAES